MKNKLCLLVLLICGCFAFSFGQEKEPDLKNKRLTIKMDKQPLGKVFRELMLKYDVAVGFEESVLDRDHNDYEFEAILPSTVKRELIDQSGSLKVTVETELIFKVKTHWITVNADNSRVEDVFNIIVGQMKNYKWEISDGVINIFPSEGRDRRYEELLKLSIKKYEVKKGRSLGIVKNNLFALPEIVGFLSENNIHSSNLRPDPEHITRPLSEELNFSDLTLKELLNKITKVKRGGWILKQNKIFRKQEKEYIELSI